MDESGAAVIHKESTRSLFSASETAVLQTPDKQPISFMSERFGRLYMYFNMTSTCWMSHWESPLSSALIWKKQYWIEQSKKSLKVVTGPRFKVIISRKCGHICVAVTVRWEPTQMQESWLHSWKGFYQSDRWPVQVQSAPGRASQGVHVMAIRWPFKQT